MAIVRVFFSEDDRHRGAHLYEALISLARELRVAGATVMRGVEGFGASGQIHSSRVVRPSEDLPMIVEVVDKQERLEAYAKEAQVVLEQAEAGGLITMEAARGTFVQGGRPAA